MYRFENSRPTEYGWKIDQVFQFVPEVGVEPTGYRFTARAPRLCSRGYVSFYRDRSGMESDFHRTPTGNRTLSISLKN